MPKNHAGRKSRCALGDGLIGNKGDVLIPIDQNKLHTDKQKGNCFAASLASILEIPINKVPEFEDMNPDEWWFNFIDWLKTKGFTIIHWDKEVELPGYYLVMGTSPRNPKINHQVIFKGGKMVHDPHPSRDGVVDIKEVMVLVPLDPSKYKYPEV